MLDIRHDFELRSKITNGVLMTERDSRYSNRPSRSDIITTGSRSRGRMTFGQDSIEKPCSDTQNFKSMTQTAEEVLAEARDLIKSRKDLFK